MSRLFTVRFHFSGSLSSGSSGHGHDIYFKKTGLIENTGVWSLKSIGVNPTDGFFHYNSKEKQLWCSQTLEGMSDVLKCLFTFNMAKGCSVKEGEYNHSFSLGSFNYPCRHGDEGPGTVYTPLFGLECRYFDWKIVG